MELNNSSSNFVGIPLSALGFKARDVLSKHLDKIKILPSPEGLPRDYRGLAQVAGVGCENIRNPTLGVIALWSQIQPSPTFQDLVTSLERLDRWDVCHDIDSVLQVDALNFTLKQKLARTQRSPTLETSNVVTYDDADLVKIGLPPNQKYDAYLLYSDQDEDYAQNIVHILENQYHLKLCVKDRDIIPGAGFEHEAITYLISERCNWLIVVLTPNFIDSPAQKFIYNYSVALGLSERRNKIIPCLFELSCDEAINQKLRKVTYSVHLVNFTRENPFRSNWDLLKNAITVPRQVSACSSRAIECSPAVEDCKVPVNPSLEESSDSLCTRDISYSKAVNCTDSSSSEQNTPNRPPRSKDKEWKNKSHNGISTSKQDSNEISKESCSSNNSTAYLIPDQQSKTQSSTPRLKKYLTKLVGILPPKKPKKKKMAKAVASDKFVLLKAYL